VLGEVVAKIEDDLLPALRDAAEYVNKHFTPAIDGLSKAWSDNKGAVTGTKVEYRTWFDTAVKIATFLGTQMAKQVERLTVVIGLLSRAWRLARNAIVEANRFIAVTFLEAVRTILRAAATVAEKLHLPFAKGLRSAERSLGNFKDAFNRQMDALKDEDVTIDVKGVWVPPKGSNLSMHAIVGRAGGGPIRGPGTPTSDSIPAWLSDGEHVLSAREVKGMGGHGAVEQMRRRARGFAIGGAVRPDLNLPSAHRMGTAAARALDRIASLIDRISIKVPIKGNPSILSFIRSVDPLPYIWGGVGPGGYDCSGLVGEVLNRHLGLPSYRRRFTTASIRAGQYGLRSGLGGMLNIGVTPGRGHMAGSYMGMGFEAESTRTGIKVGGAASPPSSFARTYHLAAGGAVDRRILAAYAAMAGVSVGGDPGRLRVNGFGTFDRGGWLRPGWTMSYNGTGRPERVLAPGEGAGLHVTVNIGTVMGGDARQVAAALAPALRDKIREAQRRAGVPAAAQLR
jgi:hypothetical protein